MHSLVQPYMHTLMHIHAYTYTQLSAHLPEAVLKDAKLLTDQIRERYNVSKAVYPSKVCGLMPFNSGSGGSGSSGGNNGGNNNSGYNTGKSQKQNHGGVPGNSRSSNSGSSSNYQGSRGNGGGQGSGGGEGRGSTRKNLIPISSFFEPQKNQN